MLGWEMVRLKEVVDLIEERSAVRRGEASRKTTPWPPARFVAVAAPHKIWALRKHYLFCHPAKTS